MKLLLNLLLGCTIAGQLHALESAAVVAISGKFDSASADEQYTARMELFRLIDEATAPGKDEHAAVTKTLVTVMQDPAVPHEAKKYILRAMTRVSTPDAVETLAKLLNGSDPLFKDEARLALESIHDPSAVAVLEAALKSTGDPREKIGLINSLAMQKAGSSIILLAPLTGDPDADTATAAIRALAKIGGPQAIQALQKSTAGNKPDIEEALIIASAGDPGIAQSLLKTSKSETVQTSAFIALMKSAADGAKATAITDALKSQNSTLRHAALKYGIEMNLGTLRANIAQSMAQMPVEDRLVVLANIHLLKPEAVAEQTALASVASDDEDEKIAAITALGKVGSKPAFLTVLRALAEKSPRTNQAAATALAETAYPAAETDLLAMLKGDPGPDQVLAVKAITIRNVEGANGILLDFLLGNDAAASGEAMKSFYFIATIDDLRALCAKAAATEDANRKKSLAALSAKIATRIGTDEAKKLAEPLK